MRILHTLNDIGSRGSGIVNAAVDLAIEQARQGHVVAIASTVGDYKDYKDLLRRSGVLHVALRSQPRRPWDLVRSLLGMRKALVDFKPDVVHAHTRAVLALAWFWSKFMRFLLVSHAHNIHERETVIMGLARRVIAVSESVAATLEQQGIAKHKIRVALNRNLGTPRQPALSEISGMILRRPSIVTVAGMIHRKGISELISAFEVAGIQFPDAHLYLVGEGSELALFQQQARESQVSERIHFELFQSAPQAYLLNTDIFVLASRRDSFPLVLMEARQAGCAIIASDVDGIPEALDHGRAGLLVPPGDAGALADAMARLLGNAAEREAFRHEALRGIEAFHISSFAADVDAIYNELLSTSNHHKMPDRMLTKSR